MILSISNQKGGVGKSTTAWAIATGAAKAGAKVLTIDCDAQTNLTYTMGGNPADKGVWELLTGKATANEVIQHTKQGDIIPASLNLMNADTVLKDDERTKALKAALKPVKKKYDLIIIDCAPTLGTLLLNALCAADGVIIPITADMFALQGLYQLVETIQVAQSINNKLKIKGVLFTMHNTRTVVSRDLTDTIKEKCKEMHIPVFNTTIRNGVAVREAEIQQTNLYDYAPKAKVTQDYKALLNELGYRI